jgi:hypothetical protein
MRFLVLFLFLSSQISNASPSPSRKDLTLRILSATWCRPCQILRRSLIASGNLSQCSIDGIYEGGIAVPLKTGEVNIRVQILEIDIPEAKSLILSPANPEKLEFVPFLMLYDSEKPLYQGARKDLGGDESFGPYDTAEGLSERIKSFLENQPETP